MSVELWTILIVGLSLLLYLYIGWRSRVKDSSGFFVAGQGVPSLANGAATAADWMSAASLCPVSTLFSRLGAALYCHPLHDRSHHVDVCSLQSGQ